MNQNQHPATQQPVLVESRQDQLDQLVAEWENKIGESDESRRFEIWLQDEYPDFGPIHHVDGQGWQSVEAQQAEWTMETAEAFVESIVQILEGSGIERPVIVGGVANNGSSTNDLDLVLTPKWPMTLQKAMEVLESLKTSLSVVCVSEVLESGHQDNVWFQGFELPDGRVVEFYMDEAKFPMDENHAPCSNTNAGANIPTLKELAKEWKREAAECSDEGLWKGAALAISSILSTNTLDQATSLLRVERERVRGMAIDIWYDRVVGELEGIADFHRKAVVSKGASAVRDAYLSAYHEGSVEREVRLFVLEKFDQHGLGQHPTLLKFLTLANGELDSSEAYSAYKKAKNAAYSILGKARQNAPTPSGFSL